MSKNRVFLTLVTVVTVCSFLQADVSFHVAPDGDDANAGTEEAPFATIGRAQTAVRAANQSGLTDDVVVYLRGGIYRIAEPLRFEPRDGGTAEHSVTYAASDGERVVISGGREIRGWTKTGDGLWSVDLPEVKNGQWHFRQLFADGERLARGRYPKHGFLKIQSVSPDYKTLQFTEPLPERDLGGQDTEVVVVQNWSISREVIARSNSTELTAKTPIGWVGHSHCLPKRGMSVFLENLPSLTAKPGEWRLDRQAGKLYYRAAQGEDPNTKRFVAPLSSRLVDLKGNPARPLINLHFKNISFQHTDWRIPEIGYGGIQACYYGTTLDEATCFAVPAAIEMDYCENCTIQRCRLSQLGASGIGIGAGCRSNRIVGCVISDVGATGVNVGHMRVKDPLWADWPNPRDIPQGNQVANCYIHHCGQDHWGAHGIFDAMTQETRIEHNEVAWVPYGGIATGYVWGTERTSQQNCLIEHNHVHDVMLKLNDSGCLYTLGYQPGAIIRGNLLHGVRFGGFAGGQVCNNGIFFDEGSKGFLLEGNVIYDIDQAPGGRNTAVRFNRSEHAWQTWVDNTIQTEAEPPEAARALADTAGLESDYRDLLGSEN